MKTRTSYHLKRRGVDEVLGKTPMIQLHIFCAITYILFFLLVTWFNFIFFTSNIEGLIEIDFIKQKYYLNERNISIDYFQINNTFTQLLYKNCSKDSLITRNIPKGKMSIKYIYNIDIGTNVKIHLNNKTFNKCNIIEGKVEAVICDNNDEKTLIVSLPKNQLPNIDVDTKITGLASITIVTESLYERIIKNITKKIQY